jgi:hypothetical protein
MDEFVQKIIPHIPEIDTQNVIFIPIFLVRKNAFLEYVLIVSGSTKSSPKEPFNAPVFIADLYAVTQFHFDHLILLGIDTAQNNGAEWDDSESLFPFLSAKTVHLTAERNNIPIYFAQQYQVIHRQILNSHPFNR